ncbi:conserved hypothetical protein [Frankia canadensis]|uniref:Uncharacterized protein n=1 Tax=Frankia canadensis TaxID=1836972 RepID=A0A2I2L0Z6_9ACTN|nr:protealysin inhibitor emfourin [Frankia canadensis]SNQ51575.1 conserved hypothetical protein [Frankia canadensis]SOU58865.1 conserved hypothetical protein [Frankia canadensis]
MTGDPGRVRVVLERSGGLLGRPTRRGLDTDELPEAAAARLRELVAVVLRDEDGRPATAGGVGAPATPRPGAGGADRFVYHLEVDHAGRRTVRTVTEPVPEPLRPLLDLLRTAPRLPPPGLRQR